MVFIRAEIHDLRTNLILFLSPHYILRTISLYNKQVWNEKICKNNSNKFSIVFI